MVVIPSFHYYQPASTASTSPTFNSSADTKVELITCLGVIFPSIPSQKELDDETAKRKKEEKMRLKLNRKNMFSKKGRYG